MSIPISNPIQVEPLTVEVTRADAVESLHHVAMVVADTDGKVVLAAGDPDLPVFPRSAVKIIQSLPLAIAVNTGHLKANQAELAMACASHSGEARHADTVAAWLEREGIAQDCLVCGAHRPMGPKAADALAASQGAPQKFHNNCSGKHSGFLTLAKSRGEPLAGYHLAHHPVQQRALGTLEHFIGCELDRAPVGIDGCGIPAYAMPLGNLAHGFAKIADPSVLSDDRAEGIRTLVGAIAAEPLMVAGEGRFDSEVIPHLPAGATTKVGAEGVYTAALPALGLGVALKVLDGNPRAAEFTLIRLLERLSQIANPKALDERLSGRLRNWAGEPVGELRFSTTSGREGLRFPF